MFPQLFSFIVASCVRLGRQKPSINPLCHLNANFFLACFSITALQSHEEEVRVAEIHDFPLPLDGAVAVSLSSPYSLEATKVVSTTIDLFCPVFWSYFLFPLQIVAEPSNPTLFFLWNVSHNFCELFMWQRSGSGGGLCLFVAYSNCMKVGRVPFGQTRLAEDRDLKDKPFQRPLATKLAENRSHCYLSEKGIEREGTVKGNHL